MTPRVRYNFWMDADQREALRRLKEDEGISESEAIRRAISEWLIRRGVMKADRKRVLPRKRS